MSKENGFNSMIVRLKGAAAFEADLRATYKFQFYDSPIKSSFKESLKRYYSSFNSMIVRLKARTGARLAYINMFQFYDSPIKSKFHSIIPLLLVTRFNSMIVRLKVLRLINSLRLSAPVSIL